jgi:PAS domain S-box-containing protein
LPAPADQRTQMRGRLSYREALAERISRVSVPAVPALAIVALVEALLVLIDLALGKEEAVATAFVIGPFVAALISRTSVAAIAGVLATALALASGLWNESGTGPDAVRAAVVAFGSCFAVFGAWLRERSARSVRRLAILAAIAEIADGSSPLAETVQRFCERLLPEVADIALLDVVIDGQVTRLGIAASGPRSEWLKEVALSRQPPVPDAPTGSSRAISRGEPQLIQHVSEEVLAGIAHDDDDLQRVRAIEAHSVIVVPLEARGKALGALTLITTADSGRRLDDDDFFFAQVVGGRAALALDNAGLFRELSSIEQQFETVLDNLADAVTVQRADGRLVYANQAAADMLGAPSRLELVATPPAKIADRFESYEEDGTPLVMERLPGRRVLRGEQPEPMLVRAVDRMTGEERWRMIKASPVELEDDRRLVVNVIEDVTEVKRAEIHQRLLSEATRALSASLDYERTLQRVAEVAIPDFADWCSVNFPRRDGVLAQAAVAHRDPEKVALARRLHADYPTRIEDPGMGEVVRTGVPQLMEIPDELLRERARSDEHYAVLSQLGLRSAIVVPIQDGKDTIGVMTFATAESGRVFDEQDRDVAAELARRAGVAIQNARLFEQRSAVAHTLQEALIPAALPEIPGWDVATVYSPAAEGTQVGGDFYDAFPVPTGWMLVIGDVAGRGIDAGAITALCRYTLRTSGSLNGKMEIAVSQLNDWLLEQGEAGICTVAALTLQDDGEAEMICAGHPPPLILRDGEVHPLEEHGPMLGFAREVSWPIQRFRLEQGDQLLLYTDGVIELPGESGRFGEDRLRRAVADAASPAEALARIGSAHRRFSSEPSEDDIAMVAVMRKKAANEELARPPAASAHA